MKVLPGWSNILEHIDGLKQLGDLLAKPLDRMGFEELLNDMGVQDHYRACSKVQNSYCSLGRIVKEIKIVCVCVCVCVYER